MSSSIPFIKMHSLGNDFVIIDAEKVPEVLGWDTPQWQQLADRHRGVGCDQILLLGESEHQDVAVSILNADGSQAEHCGNGLRCVGADYLRQSGQTWCTLELAHTVVRVTQQAGNVSATLGCPEFLSLPEALTNFEIQGYVVPLRSVQLGNPHLIVMVQNIETAPVASLGERLSTHEAFSEGVNVGFVQIEDQQHVHVRTYERGVGETSACGSNACAAVAVGRQLGQLTDVVTVAMPGGELQVAWPGGDHAMTLSGPVSWVFEGVYFA